MGRKRALSVAICASAIMALSANAAIAGEIKGNGERIEVHGNSICAYSGLDDPDEDQFGRTQNWGQLPKFVKDGLKGVGHPGVACNPNNAVAH